MHEIRVKRIPSVNHYVKHAKGRHYKSKDVAEFERAVDMQLPRFLSCGGDSGKGIRLAIVFVLRKDFYRRDLDNMPKTFIDRLAKFYGFNDSRIAKIAMEKRLDKTLDHEKILWRME